MSSLDKNRTVFIKSLDHALHKLDRVHDKASCQQHYSGITKLEGAQFDFFFEFALSDLHHPGCLNNHSIIIKQHN